jgi:outer membrane autotransporter protein
MRLSLTSRASGHCSISTRSSARSAVLKAALGTTALVPMMLIATAALGQADTATAPILKPSEIANRMTPTFKSWTDAGGTFQLNADSRIVLVGAKDDLTDNLQSSLGAIQQLRYATGFELPIVTGEPQAGDIVLNAKPSQGFYDAAKDAKTYNNPLNDSRNTYKNVFRNIEDNVINEGYEFNVTEDTVTINFDKSTGALRGLNTLGQLLMTDGNATGQHSTIPTGSGIDFPSLQTREVMLDVARKFMTPDEIIGTMAKMNLNKLNTLQIHLNDTSPTGDHFRLYSPDRPELIPTDGNYYTKADWDRMEAAAAAYGIKIIPEFESPGHAGLWSRLNPDFPLVNGNKAHLNVQTPEAADKISTYIADIVKEFTPWFKGDTIHLGGEESENPPAAVTNYINMLVTKISAEFPDKKFAIWAYNTPGNGLSIDPNLNKDIQTYVWGYWLAPEKLRVKVDASVVGTDWIMARGLYVVPLAGSGYLPQGLSAEAVYNRMATDFGFERDVPTGNMLANWNDFGNRYGFEHINAAIAQMLPGFGQGTWGQPQYDSTGKLIPWSELAPYVNKVSQEVSSFWIRDRFPYMTAAQAEKLLQDTASHRYLNTSNQLLTGGNAANDPMGWDPLDMAIAYRGPTDLGGTTYIAELPGEGNAFEHQAINWVCQDLGFARGEKTHSACDVDTWSNDIRGDTLGPDAQSAVNYWNQRKSMLGIAAATSAEDIPALVVGDVSSYVTAIALVDKELSLAAGRPSAAFTAAQQAVAGNPIAKDFLNNYVDKHLKSGTGKPWYELSNVYELYKAYVSQFPDASAIAQAMNAETIATAVNEYNTIQPLIDQMLADASGGSIAKYGQGTLILTGNNSFSDGIQFNGGVVQVSKDANLGDPSGPLAFDGGTLAFDASFDLAATRPITIGKGSAGFDTGVFSTTVAQAISGEGHLFKFGSGTLTLAAINQYTGDTVIQDGVVALKNAGDVSASSGIAVNSDTSTFDISAADGDRTVKGLNGVAGSKVELGANTLTVDTIGRSVFAGSMSGTGGLIKSGEGRLHLLGDSTYTGPTVVKKGVLTVDGSITSDVTVSDAAVLTGNGKMLGLSVAAGAIVAPGNSIGVLTVNGNYTQAANATYEAELGPNETADLIDVSGTATLAAGTKLRAINAGAEFRLGQRYRVLSAAGGVSGTFDFVSTALSPFLSVDDVYTPNDVYLEVAQTRSLASAGDSPNQIATADAIDSLPTSDKVRQALVLLPSKAAAQMALDQLSGEVHASAQTALFDNPRMVQDAVLSRLNVPAGGRNPAGMSVAPAGGSEGQGAAGDLLAPGSTFWTYGYGTWGENRSDGNAAALDRQTGGMLVGLDGELGNWRLGVLAGYGQTSFGVVDRSSSGSSNDYNLGIYGGTEWGDLSFSAGASLGWHQVRTSRSVALPGLVETLKGDYDAQSRQAFAELSYDLMSGPAVLEPFVNLAYVSLETQDFAETGGAAALRSNGYTTDGLFTTIGVRGSVEFDMGELPTTLTGMIGWRHAVDDVVPGSTHAFAGGSNFTVAGAPLTKDAALVQAGLNFELSPQSSLGVSSNGLFSTDSTDHGVKLDFRMRF